MDLIFQDARQFSGKRIVLLSHGAGTIGYLHAKSPHKLYFNSYLCHIQNLLKVDLKSKTINFLEEKIGINLDKLS